ncbi:hypothetical protein PAGU1579_15350 [Veillonella tobetsuensis]|uniref:Uncharacterized protein n=1 Tax=Veillonella tobetsuensis TaxID=1110546 RepID=A0A480B8U6_9FIRM|nr:hypothetical protein [Veillonella tobetsuensis]GCL69766.1 hypothetical protein PAGU1579_15350 [Veillonella tobetsuensis]
MDSILSTVLSIFQHNPIFVLAIIGYIAFSFLKGGKSEDSDEYENSGEARTWEEMEREYGISIEKKPVEPSSEDLLYDDDFYRDIFKNRPIENQHPEAPLRKKGGRLFQYDDTETSEKHVEVHPSNDKTQTVLASENHYDEASTTQQSTLGLSKKTSIKSTSFSTNTTRSARESVTGPSLNERLADFKRDKAMKEGKVLLSDVGVTAKPVETKKARKSHHAVKEGMKWAFILDKPKALRHRAR